MSLAALLQITFYLFMIPAIMFYHAEADAADDIVCENASCSFDPDLTIENDDSEADYSYFDIIQPLDNLNFYVNPGNTPREFRTYVETRTINSVDFSANTSGTAVNDNAGNILLISDSIKDVNLTMNGYNGADAVDASYSCATKVLAGEYGADVLTNFNNIRTVNPGLPTDRCVADDLLYISANKFSCPAGYTEDLNNDGNTVVGENQIESTRWTKKKICKGEASRRLCLEKRFLLSCTERAVSWDNNCKQTYQKPPNPHIYDYWQTISKVVGASPNYISTTLPSSASTSMPPTAYIVDPASVEYESEWDDDGVCVPGTYSGWQRTLGTVNISESYYNGRKAVGKTDGDICDEIFQRPATNSGTSSEIKYWMGWFDGGSKNRNITFNIPSDHKLISLIDWTPGTTRTHYCGYQNSCGLWEPHLDNFGTPVALSTSPGSPQAFLYGGGNETSGGNNGYQSDTAWSRRHSTVHWTGSFFQVRLHDSDCVLKTVSGPGGYDYWDCSHPTAQDCSTHPNGCSFRTDLRAYTHFSLRVRYYYLDPRGVKRIHTLTLKTGHQ